MKKVFKEIILKLRLIFIPCSENSYRPKFLESKFLFYYLIFLLILKFITVPFLIYLPKTIFFADITGTAIIKLTNQERESLGVNPLKENSQLNQAAYLKAQDMIKKDYFSHQGPEGESPWHWFQETGYDYQYAGENLAIGFLDSKEVYGAWKRSLSHRANLLNPNYQDIGIAVLGGQFGEQETTLVVQLFGSPKIKTTLKEEPTEFKEVTTPETPPMSREKEEVSEKIAVAGKFKESPPSKNTFAFNFFSFMSTNYNDVVQKIIYFSLLLIITCLIINIFIKFDVQHKDLIIKTLFFIALLALFIYFDKELIIRLIPHNFSIL